MNLRKIVGPVDFALELGLHNVVNDNINDIHTDIHFYDHFWISGDLKTQHRIYLDRYTFSIKYTV